MTIYHLIFPFAILLVSFLVFRFVKVKKQNNVLNSKRFERIQLLYDKLEFDEPVSEKDILPFAENLLTREMTFQLLKDHDITHLFPEAYNTIIKAAESNLANWLEFPTELDKCPDEMKHLKRITFDFDGQNNYVHYEIFQYRTNEPHWAAEHGWIIGIVGPYFDDSKPYDFPSSTFSRIGSTETPDNEAKWVHENISLRR